MPRKFKLNDVKYVLLTYPDCPDEFDPQQIIERVVSLGAVYRLGRELHQNGKPHYHCYVEWPEFYSNADAGRLFDVGGRHPNCKVFSANPARRWDYVGKHADKIFGHYIIGDQCPRPSGDPLEQRSQNDIWVEILAATTRDEFLARCATLAPKQLACSFGNIRSYAEWRYRPNRAPYVTPPGLWDIPSELTEWADENCQGGISGRSANPNPNPGGGSPPDPSFRTIDSQSNPNR